MAANKYIVQEGQNIYDIAVQEYGDLEQLFTIFVKNPEININTDLTALQELNIDAIGQGNEDVKTDFNRTNYITNNADNNYTPEEGSKLFQDGDGVLFQNGSLYNFN